MKYAITTFGCQMNVHDSDRMHEVLRRAGHEQAESPEEAKVVIVNTCSVREKAEHKLLSELGRLAKRKRTEKDLVIVAAGCVAQQEGEKLLSRAEGLDLVIGPDNIASLPRLLQDVEEGGLPVAETVFDLDAPRFLTAETVSMGAVTSFVTTMKGCNERCSFCIVPHTRGPERYRASEDIVREIAALVRGGVREVTLLGQTVNSYRDPDHRLPPASDDPDETEFAELLRAIARDVPELKRLRYTSPHPRHLVPSLIAAHGELGVLPRHVHLPVQSGADRMLRRMIRRYTRAEYVERVGRLRASATGVTVSTDVIVGFPGETEADFLETLSLIEEIGFVGVFAFKYSPRPFTPALKLGDDVSEAEKSERLARLFEVSERLMREHLDRLVGTEVRVLVEGRDKRSLADGKAVFTGRSQRNEIVHIPDPAAEALMGTEVPVSVVRAYKHSLEGELDAATRKLAAQRIADAPIVKPKRGLVVLADTP